MKYIKSYKIFESNIDDIEDIIKDLLVELEDDGLMISIDRTLKDVEDGTIQRKIKRSDIYLEVYINRPWGSLDREMPNLPIPPGGKYPGNLFFWSEIKDAITRLTEWYYSQSIYDPIAKNPNLYRWEKDESPLRFFGSGIEMCFGFTNTKDFENVGDLISFSNFRILIKL